jgi:hypothetical protein
MAADDNQGDFLTTATNNLPRTSLCIISHGWILLGIHWLVPPAGAHQQRMSEPESPCVAGLGGKGPNFCVSPHHKASGCHGMDGCDDLV